MVWIRAFSRAQTPLNSSNLVLYHYFTITVLPLYYYCTATVITTTVLLLYYCITTALLLHYYCTIACTTTVLHTTAPYQASDVVDCGGESLQNDGFFVR